MKQDNPPVDPVLAPHVAHALEQTQIAKYHTRAGHGFSAEDANALIDRLCGRSVEQVGTNNRRNGADRIAGGIAIQTKYCQTARLTVMAAFCERTGLYRYDGQLLEVPSDQFEQCVLIMRDRIAEGKVPGITDANEADRLIRCGGISYKQARNLARAGNIDSLTFDAASQTVTCTFAFAITFAVHFARRKWSGDQTDHAVIRAIEAGVLAGGVTLITGVVAAQILRLRAAAMGAAALRGGIRLFASIPAGRFAVDSVAHASLGKAVYGGAASNHVAKLFRTNMIVATVAIAVTAVPDLYRAAIQQSISWQQFSKNLTVSAVGIGSGTVGWIAGAGTGAALGTAVPLVGTFVGAVIGGICGAVAGGFLGTTVAQTALDCVVIDDARRMLPLLENAIAELAADHLLTDSEMEALLARVQATVDGAWLRTMYQAHGFKFSDAGRQAFAYQAFDPTCLEITLQRPRVELPALEMIEEAVQAIAAEAAREAPPMRQGVE